MVQPFLSADGDNQRLNGSNQVNRLIYYQNAENIILIFSLESRFCSSILKAELDLSSIIAIKDNCHG